MERFIHCCQTGDLDQLKDIYHTDPIIDPHYRDVWAYRTACYHQHKHIVRWLVYVVQGVDIYARDNEAFRVACENNHISFAKWLYYVISNETIDVRAFNDYTFRYCCESGYTELSLWLSETCNLYIIESIDLDNDNSTKIRFKIKSLRSEIVNARTKVAKSNCLGFQMLELKDYLIYARIGTKATLKEKECSHCFE